MYHHGVNVSSTPQITICVSVTCPGGLIDTALTDSTDVPLAQYALIGFKDVHVNIYIPCIVTFEDD